MSEFSQGFIAGFIIGFIGGGAIVFVMLMAEAWRRYTEKHQP